MKHPIQPLEKDEKGILRFKKNAIVEFLSKGHHNELASMDFPQEDFEQLAQLIGYSLSEFSGLSYVNNETVNTAERMAKVGKSEDAARIEYLEETLEEVRKAFKGIVPKLFDVHEDDLTT